MECPFASKRQTSAVSSFAHSGSLGELNESEREARGRRRRRNLLPELNAAASGTFTAPLQPTTPTKMEGTVFCVDSPSSIVSLDRNEKDLCVSLMCEESSEMAGLDLDSVTPCKKRSRRDRMSRDLGMDDVSAMEESPLHFAAEWTSPGVAVTPPCVAIHHGGDEADFTSPCPRGVEAMARAVNLPL